jgi:tripartite-type tricarboxylate transporter receptor subunit TctC
VASLRRSPAAPGLPTVDEAALPGFEATTWHGVMVPAGTPQAFAAYIRAETAKWAKVVRESGAKAE